MHKTTDGLSAQSTVTLVQIALKEQQQTENYRRGLVPLEGKKIFQEGDFFLFIFFLVSISSFRSKFCKIKK